MVEEISEALARKKERLQLETGGGGGGGGGPQQPNPFAAYTNFPSAGVHTSSR